MTIGEPEPVDVVLDTYVDTVARFPELAGEVRPQAVDRIAALLVDAGGITDGEARERARRLVDNADEEARRGAGVRQP